MPKRKASSKRWLREHERDVFVQKARGEGFRSRAAYKLQEIDQRDRLLKPGMTVIDLGAAPGGWSQVASKRLSGQGTVIAVDLLEMPTLAGVTFIQGDFSNTAVVEQIRAAAGGLADLVLSDMAPNMSGMRAVDQPRMMHLVESVLYFAEQSLKPGGDLLLKIFHGEGVDSFLRMLRGRFKKVAIRKPEASRDRSSETYVLARGLVYSETKPEFEITH
jgi:23S rRNA (uridine2552-2'-O)-methyltransferase